MTSNEELSKPNLRQQRARSSKMRPVRRIVAHTQAAAGMGTNYSNGSSLQRFKGNIDAKLAIPLWLQRTRGQAFIECAAVDPFGILSEPSTMTSQTLRNHRRSRSEQVFCTSQAQSKQRHATATDRRWVKCSVRGRPRAIPSVQGKPQRLRHIVNAQPLALHHNGWRCKHRHTWCGRKSEK